ncbi:MAG: hypothetical protein QM734_11055 [Cyclobacteriaceae bacterium]
MINDIPDNKLIWKKMRQAVSIHGKKKTRGIENKDKEGVSKIIPNMGVSET